ncbi:hypothetical protein QOT17_020622, partial [Balamuthia mandrillaris]
MSQVYFRGRAKALKKRKEKLRKLKEEEEQQTQRLREEARKKNRSVAQKIRDVRRLLSKTNLSPEVRQEKEILLQGLQRKQEQMKKAELIRKRSKKYHLVKFV